VRWPHPHVYLALFRRLWRIWCEGFQAVGKFHAETCCGAPVRLPVELVSWFIHARLQLSARS
jgi:hypothetical protein